MCSVHSVRSAQAPARLLPDTSRPPPRWPLLAIASSAAFAHRHAILLRTVVNRAGISQRSIARSGADEGVLPGLQAGAQQCQDQQGGGRICWIPVWGQLPPVTALRTATITGARSHVINFALAHDVLT